MPADPLVACESLSVHYIGADTWVLDGVSFEQLAGPGAAGPRPPGGGGTRPGRPPCRDRAGLWI